MTTHHHRLVVVLFVLWISVFAILLPCNVAADQHNGRPLCKIKQDCVALLGDEHSECHGDGFCTNPFYSNGGCLATRHPQQGGSRQFSKRLCSSSDPLQAGASGACIQATTTKENKNNPTYEEKETGYTRFQYPEIRLHAQNWDTAILGTWILQIVLNEILRIPTTVETSSPNATADFYDLHGRMDYNGLSYDANAMATAEALHGNCQYTNEPCAHFFTEIWDNGLVQFDGNIRQEPLRQVGVLGGGHWFIPKFALEEDPTLASYTGLQGEENREKLARTFKRPIRWKEYCEWVSTNNCSQADETAVRRPADETEADALFVDNLYTGYFRATEKNNCTANPSSCTGHFTDYPCGWASYFWQQAYHLSMALEADNPRTHAGGYTPKEMKEIWDAANATLSPVLMVWWFPEKLYTKYLGTRGEFTHVTLPPITQACIDNRVPSGRRCNVDETKLDWRGAVGGACDTSMQILHKMTAKHAVEYLRPITRPSEAWSPGYDVLQNFQMTELQFNAMLQEWNKRDSFPSFSAREVACEWVVDNLELIQGWIPPTYPRVLQVQVLTDDSLFLAALGLALGVAVSTIAISAFFFVNRRARVIYDSQHCFLALILTGVILILNGAVLLVVEVSDFSCTFLVWLTSLGYCFQLVPMALRMNAIQVFLNTGRNMRRVRLDKDDLGKWFGGALVLVCVFLILWTFVDRPKETFGYELTSDETTTGETVVLGTSHCASDDEWWHVTDIVWKMAVLLLSLVLALGPTNVKENINDTRPYAILFMLQLANATSRLVLLVTTVDADPTDLMAVESILLSLDASFVLILIFGPLIIAPKEAKDETEILPELFLRTSIVTMDITGFLAWSSVREPAQVFSFLEAIFKEFDTLSQRRGMFKVETVGDMYVAASGIPREHPDHALLATKFAMNCIYRMKRITKELEVIYGPDTSSLGLKCGIACGQVTGGYLHQKNARFQLFGDTVNVSGRMQASSEKDRIHISNETAALLRKAGKGHWLEKREDKIFIEGRGTVQTFFVDRYRQSVTGVDIAGSECSSQLGDDDRDLLVISKKAEKEGQRRRLIEWNTRVLLRLLKQICARREAAASSSTFSLFPTSTSTSAHFATSNRSAHSAIPKTVSTIPSALRLSKTGKFLRRHMSISRDLSDDFSNIDVSVFGQSVLDDSFCEDEDSRIPIESIKEIIMLPPFDPSVAKKLKDNELVDVSERVVEQLKDMVAAIANLYPDWPFHNFAHASHVVMSVVKYMNRIVAGAELHLDDDDDRMKTKNAEQRHKHTYGITSDPHTQFACVFAALIHDAEHPGVPNLVFAKENAEIAAAYKYRSIAEQRSFDVAWTIFMDDKYKALREKICADETELSRFRELIINGVMATDLLDKDLKKLRNVRWEMAFKETPVTYSNKFILREGEDLMSHADTEAATAPPDEALLDIESFNRKATIVIEHLIQASDVAHTMQHWDVYQEWNERLFMEQYVAYKKGRTVVSPVGTWFEGEVRFFDFFIIPLSEKLRDCGVFGVSSDENFNYASENRRLWVTRGREIVEELRVKAEAQFDSGLEDLEEEESD